MLLLVPRPSGDLLRFEFGAPLIPDETPASLVRWFLDDPDHRFEELWEMKPGDIRAAVSDLLPGLQDDPGRLAAAIRVLGSYGLKDDHELIEPHMEHPHPAVKLAAIKSFGRMGKGPRHGILLPLLDDPDPGARRAAAVALGKFGIPAVIPDLDEASARHPELVSDVRTAKARIAAIGKRDFKGILEAIFAGREWDDLLSLMLFLKRFLRETVPDRNRTEDERAHAIWALGLWRIRRAGYPIQMLLADPTTTPRLKLEAVRAIGRMRLGSAIETLAGLLRDESCAAPLREEAAIALGRIGHQNAYSPLVGQWDAAPAELRVALRSGLRRLARPPAGESVEALRMIPPSDPRQILRIEDDLELRRGYDEAVVRARLESGDVAARRDAVLLAGQFGTQSEAATLARIADGDPDRPLRIQAEWAAEQIAGRDPGRED